MAAKEIRKRPSSHRTRTVSKSSRSLNNPKDENPTPKISNAAENPTDVDALRQARLAYQSKTPEERQRGMIYEYVKTTRELVSEDKEKETRSRSTRHRTSQRKERKPSAGTHRRTEHERRSDPHEESDEEYEYVYERTGERHERHESRPKGNATHTRQRTTSIAASKKKEETRRMPERRRTDPEQSRTPRYRDEEEPGQGESPAPRVSASRELPSRPVVRRSATTASRPHMDSGVGRPREQEHSHRRKSTSMFGGLFANAAPAPQKKVSCLTCGDDEIPVSRSAKLPCGHCMCHSCLKRVFTMSVTDPAHMPPRCCTEEAIDLKHVEKLFNADFKVLWNRKYNEYKTKNRIYCPSKKCGLWIKPKYIIRDHGRKIGRCKNCGTRVCGTCSQKMHTTRECPKDPETKAFVEVAKKEGWQKCYNCSATVELKEGCNHMTCRCKAEFCMVCGLKWKSCDCPWFSYEAVDAHLGDPLRQQQDADRRREQVGRDEEIARALQRMTMFENIRAENNDPVAGDNMNPNLVQQARDALTANYAHAGHLINQFMMRNNNVRAMPGPVHDLPEPVQDGEDTAAAPARPTRRMTTRGRNSRLNREADERRLHEWANTRAE